jgi:hypothetical protein
MRAEESRQTMRNIVRFAALGKGDCVQKSLRVSGAMLRFLSERN